MPQMNPMNWYLISFSMFSTFMILLSLIYFSYFTMSHSKMNKKSSNNFMLYMW
uniref:ATP synthase complex subunit 8 n=1 Tax=Quadristernoseta cf. longigynium XFX-2019 TaxID=2695872 RepID=A0A6B9WD53_9ACAR|nr:ATP synthase subunit 8 [Quadristernoseta cf. longigynium XFX-2019]